jgi:hypothetical protein
VDAQARRRGAGRGASPLRTHAREDELDEVVRLVEPQVHAGEAVHGPHGAGVLVQRQLVRQHLGQRVFGVDVLVLRGGGGVVRAWNARAFGACAAARGKARELRHRTVSPSNMAAASSYSCSARFGSAVSSSLPAC